MQRTETKEDREEDGEARNRKRVRWSKMHKKSRETGKVRRRAREKHKSRFFFLLCC